ncbi:MAG: sirohydrochlorin cobaltochelatase [Syntrophomonadaceae bacterium]|jgi:cobalamin biosynthesis Co2+ chelatase CbiK
MEKINKKAILVVSFGTSHHETREKTIGAIEKDIAAAYPEYEIRRAFTSGRIIEVLANRDGIVVDNVTAAMDRLLEDGFQTVIVQPTHVINGQMNEEMETVVTRYVDKFEKIKIGSPLLTHTEDYQKVIRAIMGQFPDLDDREALVLMGHGTGHRVNTVYTALDKQFKEQGYANVFVGTVEAYPDVDTVEKRVRSYHPQRVILLPLMIVAGDHAVNDMAGDAEDSWKSIFAGAGYEVKCLLQGLGEIQAIRDIFLEHIAAAIPESKGMLNAV